MKEEAQRFRSYTEEIFEEILFREGHSVVSETLVKYSSRLCG